MKFKYFTSWFRKVGCEVLKNQTLLGVNTGLVIDDDNKKFHI